MSRTLRNSIAGLSLLAAAGGIALWAQDDIIRVKVTEVVIPVTVTDVNNKFVTGLGKEDFKIYDQGVRQEIKFFGREKGQPVVIGFLLDLSNTMRAGDRFGTFRDMMSDMVPNLLSDDARYQGYLIGYGTKAELMVDTTKDASRIVDKLAKITPGGGSALYDAIWMACTSRKILPGEPMEPHRVIIIMGDGHDNNSQHTLTEVIEQAQRSFVSIYAVSTDAFGLVSEEGKNLQRLADATGGRVEYPLQNTYDHTQGYLSRPANEGNREFHDGTGGYTGALLKSIYDSIRAIAGEIQTQYVLRYTPTNLADMNEEHSVRVEVTSLSNVQVHARPKYYLNMK